MVAGAGLTAVEAVAATGAHPTQKHAQRHPPASKRSCFIVPSGYAPWSNTTSKKNRFYVRVYTLAQLGEAMLFVFGRRLPA